MERKSEVPSVQSQEVASVQPKEFPSLSEKGVPVKAERDVHVSCRRCGMLQTKKQTAFARTDELQCSCGEVYMITIRAMNRLEYDRFVRQ